ncbi:MAG: hypothetical protein BM563_08780 [Bacteroidetes bacterium MedPE-SWsnd-G1]|nr:MAG: hypothetical protein BM563_08780 [Bacteroidetes bacterium MedPE-SWsnd-G1]
MKNNQILTIIILFISLSTFACECAIIGYTNENKDNYQEQCIIKGFEDADFIFYGKVIELTDREMDGYSDMFGWENPNTLKEKIIGHFPVFNLKKIYKGKSLNLSKKEIQVYQDWSICITTFEKNKEYVVFGYLDQEGKLKTSICAPNKMIDSKKHLQVFKKYKS